MILPHDERTFILDLHNQGKSPEQIAAALTQRRALAEVQGVLHDHAGNLQQSELLQSMMHYVFLPPRKEDEDIQPMRVYLKDFPAFCTRHNLSEKDMQRVALGELEAHRGWKQGPLSAMYCAMVSRALVTHQEDVRQTMLGAKKASPAQSTRTVTHSPVSLPPTTFQP
jgi:hypothetical protein